MLRPLTPADHDAVVALNQAEVDLLSPMDSAKLTDLIDLAERADAVVADGRFAGFVLVTASDVDYDSENLAWFRRFYPDGDFAYLDRVALDPRFRRLGLGGRAYAELEAYFAETGRARMCLEINLDPPNHASLAFHRGRGYEQVGTGGEPGHILAMMSKNLAT